MSKINRVAGPLIIIVKKKKKFVIFDILRISEIMTVDLLTLT